MGTIELSLFRVHPEGQQHAQGLRRVTDLNNEPISEKSKKAGWHKVTYVFDRLFLVMPHSDAMSHLRLGPERRSIFKEIQMVYRRLDPKDRPYITFRFLYRPRG